MNKKRITITMNPEVKEKVDTILHSQGKKLSSIIELHLIEIIKQNSKEIEG